MQGEINSEEETELDDIVYLVLCTEIGPFFRDQGYQWEEKLGNQETTVNTKYIRDNGRKTTREQ